MAIRGSAIVGGGRKAPRRQLLCALACGGDRHRRLQREVEYRFRAQLDRLARIGGLNGSTQSASRGSPYRGAFAASRQPADQPSDDRARAHLGCRLFSAG
jgi:hypothetical protein